MNDFLPEKSSLITWIRHSVFSNWLRIGMYNLLKGKRRRKRGRRRRRGRGRKRVR